MNPTSEKPEPQIPAQQYLDLAGVLILALDPQRRITMINHRGCQILGYEESELLGQDWFQLCLPAEIQTQASLLFDQLLASQKEAVEYAENPVRHKDGSLRLLAWHHNVIRDPSGQIIGTLHSADDITERKKAEEAVRIAHQQLVNIIEFLPDATFVIDQDKRVVAWNRASESCAAGRGDGSRPF
jgi:PAS domain S-box-containing protein